MILENLEVKCSLYKKLIFHRYLKILSIGELLSNIIKWRIFKQCEE